MAEAKNVIGKKEAFIEALSSFIQKRRKILLAIVIIVLVGLAGMTIALQMRKNRHESSFLRLEEVQKKYAEWMRAKDEAEKEGAAAETLSRANSLEEELLRGAEAVIAEYGDLHAGPRAADITAGVLFRKKEYQKAAETWKALADSPAAGYLAPIALCNAAAAWEEAGKPDAAAEALSAVVSRFSASFPDIPRVLFSLGRLAEGRDAYDDAKGFYDRMINEHPGSSWTKLAYNRIIILEVQNKIKK